MITYDIMYTGIFSLVVNGILSGITQTISIIVIGIVISQLTMVSMMNVKIAPIFPTCDASSGTIGRIGVMYSLKDVVFPIGMHHDCIFVLANIASELIKIGINESIVLILVISKVDCDFRFSCCQ